MPSKNFILRKRNGEPWIRAKGYDLYSEGNSIQHAVEEDGMDFCLFAPLKQTKPNRRSANTNFDKEEI